MHQLSSSLLLNKKLIYPFLLKLYLYTPAYSFTIINKGEDGKKELVREDWDKNSTFYNHKIVIDVYHNNK